MAKSIKIWDGWRVYYDGKTTDLSCPPDVWKWFKDTLGIELTNDQQTNITREMYCFGHQDIELTNGKHIVLDIIPVKEICWKEHNGEIYYVSPNSGWIYEFYKLKAFNEKYPNTDMICCMCSYYNEKGILETGCESLEVMEIVGWQFSCDDEIPKEDMELMIEEYEERRIGK